MKPFVGPEGSGAAIWVKEDSEPSAGWCRARDFIALHVRTWERHRSSTSYFCPWDSAKEAEALQSYLRAATAFGDGFPGLEVQVGTCRTGELLWVQFTYEGRRHSFKMAPPKPEPFAWSIVQDAESFEPSPGLLWGSLLTTKHRNHHQPPVIAPRRRWWWPPAWVWLVALLVVLVAVFSIGAQK